jgi:GT2 family glycosyltransferase
LRRDADGMWLAERGPVRFELHPGARGFPRGWVLLTGRLSPAILDRSARLLIEHDRGTDTANIPVSRAGKIFELVRLPPRVRRVVWQPSQRAGNFRHDPMRITRVSPARRLWLMARRVAFLLWTRPLEQKSRVGLGWLAAALDLAGQYRACGRLRTYGSLPYVEWFARHGALRETDRELIRRRIARMNRRTRFAVIAKGAGERMAGTRRSLDAQLYREFTILSSADVIPRECAYAIMLEAGDQVTEHALYWIAEAIAAAPKQPVLVYTDDDCITADGTLAEPRFKPDWSPEHLRSIDYVGRAAAFRREEFVSGLHGADPELDAGAVVHVPAPLYHYADARPRAAPRPRARYPVPEPSPLVSILVPTRDRLALLRGCLDSLARSTYANREILVVDNRSSEPDTLQYLAAGPHRVLRYDADYNFSAINNFAAREARGEVLVLLNNDTEVISPDWLEEMLGHLCRPGVGAVGAKLLYPGGTVQHAGDAVGIGRCADHMQNGIPGDAPGYCYRAMVAHEVSAVTGACLMTRRDLYLRLGGLDERHLPIAFNDVDYCLKVQREGLRVMFTPHARLYHHESATRGQSSDPKEAAAARLMRRRWGRRLAVDPYYNPNCDDAWADFAPADPPRVVQPWMR